MPRIAAGCRNTGKVWGEGPTGAGGRATCVVLAAREDVSSRWVEKGRREGDRRRHRKEQKPPATSPTDMFLSD